MLKFASNTIPNVHSFGFQNNVNKTSANVVHSQNNSIPYNAFVAAKTSSVIWHAKLGHPSPLILKKVLNTLHFPFDIHSTPFCDSCKLGKLHKLPFQRINITAKTPLELVYSDVWGPAPMLSAEGYRYYIAFVDAYTRFTWIFPLKLKSDAFQAFVKFKNSIELQLDRKIKCFQADMEVYATKVISVSALQVCRVYISRHVVFNEQKFPYKELFKGTLSTNGTAGFFQSNVERLVNSLPSLFQMFDATHCSQSLRDQSLLEHQNWSHGNGHHSTSSDTLPYPRVNGEPQPVGSAVKPIRSATVTNHNGIDQNGQSSNTSGSSHSTSFNTREFQLIRPAAVTHQNRVDHTNSHRMVTRSMTGLAMCTANAEAQQQRRKTSSKLDRRKVSLGS
ncbi:hypothetical protein EZV62_004034 [Acer yangbiense]|uniref:GAG-pre-integrase domain-containing protein n=1 Tax=Acer yangbiense TaxID=1000413 RepID=A0A5C7IJ58_9ROSI|nr:hypothetical protein EZV62_004034 [Acer yangbiense]